MAIQTVGVVGCGLMGSGIVQVAAQSGYSVLFVEATDELVRRGLARLRDTLEGLTARGKLAASARDETLGRIAGTASAAFGFATTTLSAIIGGVVGRGYDGTTRPLLLGFVSFGIVALAVLAVTDRGRLFARE